MQEETISFLYQTTQNVWSKKSIHALKILPTELRDYESPYTSGKSGYRKLAFEESSGRNKRRKPKDLLKTVCLPELAHATNTSLRSASKSDAVKLCRGALETVPTRALRIRKV